ncbi:cell division protein PerM [Actinotignum sp. GS-2025a]|uniref:cell division protein PerM n=1 Tax=unclassified Actinotignum TaxID=2632702 RepID=UPI003F4877B1
MLTYSRRVALALAVIQPVVLTWITVVLICLLGYTLTAASPLLGDVTWQGAARLGGSLWLLALGTPLVTAGGHIGLMPLLLTALIAWLTVRFLRAIVVEDWWDVAIATLSGAGSAGVICLLSLPQSSLLHALVGGAVLGFAASQCAWLERPAWPGVAILERGWRLIAPLAATLAALSLLLVLAAAVLGFGRAQALHAAYLTDLTGTILFTLTQLLFAPALAVWALAYVTGAGFTVGSGAVFSALGGSFAPIPGLPVFGLLPDPALRPAWLLIIPILTGLAWGVIRSLRPRDWVSAAVGALELLVLVALAGQFATGGIGPGRMLEVGTRAPLLTGCVALTVLLPFALGYGARDFWTWVRALWERYRVRRALRPAPQQHDAAAHSAAPTFATTVTPGDAAMEQAAPEHSEAPGGESALTADASATAPTAATAPAAPTAPAATAPAAPSTTLHSVPTAAIAPEPASSQPAAADWEERGKSEEK